MTNRTVKPDSPPDPLERVVQQVAGHGVERAERLVHEQDVGVLRQGAGQRHALAHAAGQLVRPPVGEAVELHRSRSSGALAFRSRARDAREPEREFDVLAGGQPGKQRRLLEEEAPGRRDLHAARRRIVKPGDQIQQGALAAAGRADEADELAGLDLQVESERASTGSSPVRKTL